MTTSRPPSRGRIPSAGPRETQEGTSPAPPDPTRHIEAPEGTEDKGESRVTFPLDLAKRLGIKTSLSTSSRWVTLTRIVDGAPHGTLINQVHRWLSEQMDLPAGPEDWEQWVKVHDLIGSSDPCITGKHQVCGCPVHQASCPCMIADYYAERAGMGDTNL